MARRKSARKSSRPSADELVADDAVKKGEIPAADSAGKSAPLIHDSLFKYLLTQMDTAGRFLRERLPTWLVEELADAPPEIVPGSFVDEELRQSQTDVLLRLPLKDRGDLLLYCLMEHKARPERLARVQLARYVMRILEKWYHTNPDGPMPAVLPVIVHNGPRPWAYSTELRDLAGPYPDVIQRHLLSLNHIVVDLCRVDDEALSEDLRLRAGLMALKHGTREREDLISHLDSVLADVPRLEVVDARVILIYISERLGSVEAVVASIQRIAGNRAQEFIHPVWRPFIEQGRKEGLAEAEVAITQAQQLAKAEAEARARAEAEARTQAEAAVQARAQAEAVEAQIKAEAEQVRQTLAATFLGLAEQRFPPVSAAAQAYILGASTSDLHGKLARILTATSLDALLGDDQAAVPPGT
jgi:hypothetical protein